jgi:xylan 1,4-beta-xylosidase
MKRTFFVLCIVASVSFCVSAQNANSQESKPAETIQVDTRAKGEPFPHFWEQMFGSGKVTETICAK